MKTKNFLTLIFLLTTFFNINSQTINTGNLDLILLNISKNNKSISAGKQYFDMKKTEFNTGLTLNDPVVEFDYLWGSPAEAGNQTELMIAQSFDFPSVYSNKNRLAESQSKQSVYEFGILKQNILLESKKTCIELIYRNKLSMQLAERRISNEKLTEDFQIKLQKGDGNLPDLNKAKLQLIEINNEYQKNITAINILNQKLTELNGGIPVSLNDTSYPNVMVLPEFENLENEIEASDYARKFLEQEKVIAKNSIDLSKSQSLPKFELGYHYQGILGDKYHGVHFGISIPLWENRNKVKLQQSKLLYSDLEIQNHQNEHYYEIKMLYENYLNLKNTLEQYESVFTTLNNTELLNKSLALGEISTIEYFMELSYFYNSYDNFLEIEKDYFTVIAELYKHKL